MSIVFNSSYDKNQILQKIELLTTHLIGANIYRPPVLVILRYEWVGRSTTILYPEDAKYIYSVKDVIHFFNNTTMDKLFDIIDIIVVKLLCYFIDSVYLTHSLINNVGGFDAFENIINNIKTEKLSEYFKTNQFSFFNPDNFEKLMSIKNFRNTIENPIIIKLILLHYDAESSSYLSNYWDIIEKQYNYILNGNLSDTKRDFHISLEEWKLLYSLSLDKNHDIYPIFKIYNCLQYTRDVEELFERCKFYIQLMGDSSVDEYFINYMKKIPNTVFKKLGNCEELINNTIYLEKVISAYNQAKDLTPINAHLEQLKSRLVFYKELENPKSSKEILLKHSYNAGMTIEAKRFFEEIIGLGITNDDETFEDIVAEDDKGSLLVVISSLINKLK